MSTMTIRILESNKSSLNAAAKAVGLVRMTDGELSGNVSALISLLAQSLKDKHPDEIKALLFGAKSE